MQLSKRLLRFVAVMCVLIGALCLALCIKTYIKGSFLDAGAPIDPNPKVIGGMKEMIRSGFFGIIPGMSVLLFISSLLLWVASKKFDSNKETKT